MYPVAWYHFSQNYQNGVVLAVFIVVLVVFAVVFYVATFSHKGAAASPSLSPIFKMGALGPGREGNVLSVYTNSIRLLIALLV